MEYLGANPWCKNGHDKRVAGVSKNHRCLACKNADQRAYASQQRRKKVSFRGDDRAVPGLRAARLALGLTQRELAEAAGIDRRTVSKMEGGRPAVLSVRREVERIIKEHGGDPGRIYGEPGLRWRPCEAGLGHPPWESATLEECPRCTGTRGHVPKKGTLSAEEQRRLMEKVPDDARFDHALNEKGRDIRASWLEHVSGGEETEVWE